MKNFILVGEKEILRRSSQVKDFNIASKHLIGRIRTVRVNVFYFLGKSSNLNPRKKSSYKSYKIGTS
jgi:hypothetical protein